MAKKEPIQLPRTYIDVQKEVNKKISRIVDLLQTFGRSMLEHETQTGGSFVEGAYASLCGDLSKQQRDLQFELDQLRRDAVIQRGDHVVVFRGRKADIGITGVVADIHYTGRYLVKDAANWRDQFVRGSWFNGDNLAKIYDET